MDRYTLAAIREHMERMRSLVPYFEEASETARAIHRERQALDASLSPAMFQAFRDAEHRRQQLELGSAHLRAMRDLLPSLTHLTEQVSGVQDFLDALQSARAYINQDSTGFLWYARESLNTFLDSFYRGPVDLLRDPAQWMDEEIDRLLAENPAYRKSRLAWILVMFVPRFRLALYEQDGEGDFDGVMQTLWEDLLDDPEVRARLRERLEKSGVREELRQSLSNHLDKLEAGELMYAIIGLYAHIEGFLAEIAVERGLIPDKESIERPDGTKQHRKGVHDLIRVLHNKGHIDDSQEKFLTFVLSNNYQANRLRHGISFEFTQERAVALVLALILILCLSWGMEPNELLAMDSSPEVEDWIEDILEGGQGEPEVSEDVAGFIEEILAEEKSVSEVQVSPTPTLRTYNKSVINLERCEGKG